MELQWNEGNYYNEMNAKFGNSEKRDKKVELQKHANKQIQRNRGIEMWWKGGRNVMEAV